MQLTSRSIALSAGVAVLVGAAFYMGSLQAQNMMGHGTMHGMMHGADGMGQHDMTNMPGLRGLDATAEESNELAVMFNNFTTLTRTVEELPNGIRTVTASTDPAVMDALVSHVVGMTGRVAEGRDPQILIQSPTLDIFFERPDAIVTDIEVTDEGIVVTQTSDDAEVVAALHTHAGEVSQMAERGMDAVHDMMMSR